MITPPPQETNNPTERQSTMTSTTQTPDTEPTREVQELSRCLEVLDETGGGVRKQLDAALERQAIVERALETLANDPATTELDTEYIEEYESRLRHFFEWHSKTKDRRRDLEDQIWSLSQRHAEQAGNGEVAVDEACPESEQVLSEVWSRFNKSVWPTDSEHRLGQGVATEVAERLHDLDAERSSKQS